MNAKFDWEFTLSSLSNKFFNLKKDKYAGTNNVKKLFLKFTIFFSYFFLIIGPLQFKWDKNSEKYLIDCRNAIFDKGGRSGTWDDVASEMNKNYDWKFTVDSLRFKFSKLNKDNHAGTSNTPSKKSYF